MLKPETLSAATRPFQGLHLNDTAFAIVSDPNPNPEKVVIRAILVRKAYRKAKLGSRMLGALAAHFADRPLTVQALVPENIAPGFFHRAGWRRQALNQFEMKIEL